MVGLRACKRAGCREFARVPGQVYCSRECSPYGLTFGTTNRMGGKMRVRAPEGLMTAREVAAATGYAAMTIDRWAREGRIPFVEVEQAGKPARCYRLAEVKAALEAMGVRPPRSG